MPHRQLIETSGGVDHWNCILDNVAGRRRDRIEDFGLVNDCHARRGQDLPGQNGQLWKAPDGRVQGVYRTGGGGERFEAAAACRWGRLSVRLECIDADQLLLVHGVPEASCVCRVGVVQLGAAVRRHLDAHVEP
eukprot:scaffold5863_cov105-Isochrysis_galbana.AAC.1